MGLARVLRLGVVRAASVEDERVRAQLRAKHPRRKAEVTEPASYSGHVVPELRSKSSVAKRDLMADMLSRLPPLTSPGPFGLRNEYLSRIAQVWRVAAGLG